MKRPQRVIHLRLGGRIGKSSPPRTGKLGLRPRKRAQRGGPLPKRSNLVEMLDEVGAADNEHTAQQLDRLRLQMGRGTEDTEGWNALISAAGHLRFEVARRKMRAGTTLYGPTLRALLVHMAGDPAAGRVPALQYVQNRQPVLERALLDARA